MPAIEHLLGTPLVLKLVPFSIWVPSTSFPREQTPPNYTLLGRHLWKCDHSAAGGAWRASEHVGPWTVLGPLSLALYVSVSWPHRLQPPRTAWPLPTPHGPHSAAQGLPATWATAVDS